MNGTIDLCEPHGYSHCGLGRLIMEHFLYLLARTFLAFIQALPIRWVARMGRCGGALAFWLDARHRRVALKNLTMCFGHEKSPTEIRAIAKENFRRLGEVYGCAMKSMVMNDAELLKVFSVKGAEAVRAVDAEGRLVNRVFTGGHFGNFELANRMSALIPGYQAVATYRGIRPPKLDQLVYRMRTVSGNILVDRRTGADDLKRAMAEGGKLLILASDQADRSGGIELPFLGYYAWTTRAPVILAMRYKCVIFVPICYRVGLGQWVLEVGEPLRMEENGKRRGVEDLMRDINAALEAGVRRDPANWFWVHDRWKTKNRQPPRAVEESTAV
ncbi:lysophospholipid acyltransferase family protein [Prosthecobacter algae]|uniref:Lysophospholipid acyltransferase family protein n=1 Tax=Prosthecobacter algae TaxID=1144682 RepID=A0ABP9NYT9_9BACT